MVYCFAFGAVSQIIPRIVGSIPVYVLDFDVGGRWGVEVARRHIPLGLHVVYSLDPGRCAPGLVASFLIDLNFACFIVVLFLFLLNVPGSERIVLFGEP